MIRVVWDPQKLPQPRNSGQGFDRLILFPGSNFLTAEQVAFLRSHDSYERLKVAIAIHDDEPPTDDDQTVLEAPLINLNSATEAQLTDLPNIGSVTANRIIGARPFDSLEAARKAAKLSSSDWAEIEPFVEV